LLKIFGKLKKTLFENSELRELRNFLKAAFFVLCVVNTIILFMSVYITKVFGLGESEIIDLIALSTIFAIIGSIFSGFISDIIGYKRSLLGVFFLWALCLLGGGLLNSPFHWIIGSLVGLSLGAIWVISRAMIIKLVPQEKIGEVFGLFNLVSYFSGMVGPLFWGLMLLYLSSLGAVGYRITCISFSLFIAVGFIFLLRIKSGTRTV